MDFIGNDTDIILKGTDGSSDDTTFLTIDGKELPRGWRHALTLFWNGVIDPIWNNETTDASDKDGALNL